MFGQSCQILTSISTSTSINTSTPRYKSLERYTEPDIFAQSCQILDSISTSASISISTSVSTSISTSTTCYQSLSESSRPNHKDKWSLWTLHPDTRVQMLSLICFGKSGSSSIDRGERWQRSQGCILKLCQREVKPAINIFSPQMEPLYPFPSNELWKRPLTLGAGFSFSVGFICLNLSKFLSKHQRKIALLITMKRCNDVLTKTPSLMIVTIFSKA